MDVPTILTSTCRSKPKRQPRRPNGKKNKSAYVNASYKIFDRGNDSSAVEEEDEAVLVVAGTLTGAPSEITDHHPGDAAGIVSVNLHSGENSIPTFPQALAGAVGRRGLSAALPPERRLHLGPRRHADVVAPLAAPCLRNEGIAGEQGDAVRQGLSVAVIHRARARLHPSGTEGGDLSLLAVRPARHLPGAVAIEETLHIRGQGRGRGRGRDGDCCLESRKGTTDGENLRLVIQEHIRKRQRLILERPAPVMTAV